MQTPCCTICTSSLMSVFKEKRHFNVFLIMFVCVQENEPRKMADFTQQKRQEIRRIQGLQVITKKCVKDAVLLLDKFFSLPTNTCSAFSSFLVQRNKKSALLSFNRLVFPTFPHNSNRMRWKNRTSSKLCIEVGRVGLGTT